MKRFRAAALVLAILLAVALARPSLAARCVGADPCLACKTCRYCHHCNEGGGTCGVKLHGYAGQYHRATRRSCHARHVARRRRSRRHH